MCKKKVTLIILVTVLLLSLATSNLVGLAKANPMASLWPWYRSEPITTPPIIVVHSPLQNGSADLTSPWLNFTVTKPRAWFTQALNDSYAREHGWGGLDPEQYMSCVKLTSYYYILDGTESKRFPVADRYQYFVNKSINPEETMSFSANFTLSDKGQHTVKVAVECENILWDPTWLTEKQGGFRTSQMTGFSDTVSFKAVLAPKISILSMQNLTFNSTSVDLSFFVDEKVPKIAYSLDAQANVTVAGNTTLTDLPAGGHNVIVYAWDVYGTAGASETLNFIVAVPAKPFPILVFVAVTSVLATVIAAIGIAVYVRRRKISKQQTSPT
jgi:hypothetical protein